MKIKCNFRNFSKQKKFAIKQKTSKTFRNCNKITKYSEKRGIQRLKHEVKIKQQLSKAGNTNLKKFKNLKT